MRKLTIILLLSTTLLGCAWFKVQKDNISTCWSDTACRTEAIQRSNEYGRQAGDIASVSGVPWAKNVAQNVVGYGSLVVLLSALGAALDKKKKESL